MPARSLLALFSAAALVGVAPAAAVAQETQTAAPAPEPAIYDVEVVARYPHDPEAFTQGLLWHDGYLYESTGQEGRSQIRRVDLTTGEVRAARAIPAEQFGEGMALWGEELVSLTWQDGVIHRWTLDTLAPVRSDPFAYEGWGLTVLDGELVASDGSATLRFLDPETYALKREVTVTYQGRPVGRINELEAVDGLIWANQWYSEAILAIDPEDGAIRKIADLSPLVREVDAAGSNAVLNGIAYDAENARWFVTGKLWPTLFEIRMVPRAPEIESAGE
ncbi:MAG: glutamine cyclotransferase [Citromicrobium sp.]|nr:glutamine cyclotransferase [Citromicrobium sp.]